MVEDTGYSRCLFRYTWMGEDWKLEGPFVSVERGGEDVRNVITDVAGVYESGMSLGGRFRIVIEDGLILRWWHTFSLSDAGEELLRSHHALIDTGDEGI